ncbi:MAG: heavy metal translocating P-type ATPase [Bacteroides sp.]|nr:heavy metal translocating P-type ATPase [Bacillota bacterium]MCM1393288.1 heavy metal translocating P-type ATPase [[Eubacterium] siraeum]MCM1455409.1 heavy metal translocating P-type ATPase [Bacteroides sp.]
MKKKFDVQGMTCSACQAHVQKALEKVDGVKSASVNLLKNNAVIEYDEQVCSPQKLESAVNDAGYKLIISDSPQVPLAKKDYALAKLLVCVGLLLVLMYFSMGNMMWGFPAPKVFDHEANPMGFALLQFLIVLPILFIYRRYFSSGFKKLFRLKPNMDSLIAVGATASLVYGIFALFMISYAQAMVSAGTNAEHWQSVLMTYHDSLYLESAGMILTLVSLGKYLEGLSKKKTTAAVTKLMDLAPKRATVLREDEEVEIPAEDVRVGDILVVKNGASVPVDGVIVEGNASLNQANITGESMPVFKSEGDEVYSSTTVTAGYFKMRASKVGDDTSIASIIRLVDEASNSKAPISKLADKISGIFVPVIFAIALVTLIANLIAGSSFELSLNFAISVVVIACPCALGLATPVSIMAGTGKGAQCGLLIKNAEILEKAHLIKTVVLDKTGTITEGKPKVTDFLLLKQGFADSEMNAVRDIDALAAVYSLEIKSEHPLALSIVEYAKAQNAALIDAEDYRSIEGRGIEGKINGVNYAIGNLKMAQDKGADVAGVKPKADAFASEGKTPLLIIRESEVVGILAVKDPVKAGSVSAIRELIKRGIKVVMLTGDNEATANVIAKEVGVSEVIADVYPADKQRVVESLKSDGKHLVAMVGDGVNDAPALTSADLGIAIGGGSDVAMECSDIVLLRNDLMDVLNVISLSRRVLNTIRLGLFWAFIYNFVCVIIATGAFYYVSGFKINPMIGALAMSVSSVSVVLNALTINFFKIKRTQSGSGGASETDDNKISQKENENMKKYVLKVDGMMCGMCEAHVNDAVRKSANVTDVKSSHSKGTTEITCEDEINVEAIKAAIEQQGYKVSSVNEAPAEKQGFFAKLFKKN